MKANDHFDTALNLAWRYVPRFLLLPFIALGTCFAVIVMMAAWFLLPVDSFKKHF